MYEYILATFTQHYTEGFSQWSKARKKKKKERASRLERKKKNCFYFQIK